MCRFLPLLFALALLVGLLALCEGIGFPTGGGGGGCCCPCGGGGGGGGGGCCGCGRRRKREAVQPHLKSSETPCPQTEWRVLMEEAMVARDAVASLESIQSALHDRFGTDKFLVNCAAKRGGESALAVAGEKAPPAEAVVPTNIRFSASGDGYCNVARAEVWCQAIAMHG